MVSTDNFQSPQRTGTLFVVATPIGNLQDISPRALETLRSVDRIACEDTRHTLRLLNHFGIQKSLISYHEFNEQQKAEALVARMSEGETLALVSDAGTPAISDPGYRLVLACRSREIPVVAIPGPSAAVAALSVSGLPSNEFMFVGFLPSKKTARLHKLRHLRSITCTLVFYEAPHRIESVLQDMIDALGDRQACIGREITKIHEEYLFGLLSKIRSRVRPIGEFVIILEGAKDPGPEEVPQTREEVLRRLGMSRNQLYDLFFKK